MVKGCKIEVQIPEDVIKQLRGAYGRKGYPDPFDSPQVTEINIKGSGRDGTLIHMVMLDCLIEDLLELEYNEVEFETEDSLSSSMKMFKEELDRLHSKK